MPARLKRLSAASHEVKTADTTPRRLCGEIVAGDQGARFRRRPLPGRQARPLPQGEVTSHFEARLMVHCSDSVFF